MTDPITVIRQYAPKLGLDPAAVVAYALTQGGTSWGAVGDHGTSFGPFQLHKGGALGSHSAQWANSPQGLRAAMGMMARAGAAGQRGPGAAAFIVGPAFGRGANPPRDEAAARAAYARAAALVGKPTAPGPAPAFSRGNGAAPQVPGTAPSPILPPAIPDVGDVGAQLQEMFASPGHSIAAPVTGFDRLQGLADAARAAAAAQRATITAPRTPGIAKPLPVAPKGGKGMVFQPGTAKPGQVVPGLTKLARTFGLTVTSGYRTVARQRELYAHRTRPGSVAAPGKSLHNSGHAIDVAITPAIRRFLAYAFAHPGQFREVFYDPAGRYIKNGRIVKGSIGGHSDHVHIGL